MFRRRLITTAVLALTMAITGSAAAGTDPVTDQTDHATVDTYERDAVRDRLHDRPIDRPIDRPLWCDRDRAPDRPLDCRPQDRPIDCDRDRAYDRPVDCRQRRPHDAITDRPLFKRCVAWLGEHTDVDYGHDVRHWLWACHRLLNHVNPPL